MPHLQGAVSLHLHEQLVSLETFLCNRIERHPTKLLQVIQSESPIFVSIHHEKHAKVAHIETVFIAEPHSIDHVAEDEEVSLAL